MTTATDYGYKVLANRADEAQRVYDIAATNYEAAYEDGLGVRECSKRRDAMYEAKRNLDRAQLAISDASQEAR